MLSLFTNLNLTSLKHWFGTKECQRVHVIGMFLSDGLAVLIDPLCV